MLYFNYLKNLLPISYQRRIPLKFLSYLLFAAFLSISIVSCKDDDMENPCDKEPITSAEFNFFRKFIGTDSIYWIPVVDTLYNYTIGTPLYFRAESSQMDSYQWTVGLDPNVFTDSVFFLYFQNTDGHLDIELNVTNEVLAECSDIIPLQANKIKSLYFKSYSDPNSLPIYGIYQGYNEDEPDSLYNIEITTWWGLYGLPKNCTYHSNAGLRYFSSGRNLVIDKHNSLPYPPSSCGRPSGFGQLQDDNKTLIFDYTVEYDDHSKEPVSKRFIGTKI